MPVQPRAEVDLGDGLRAEHGRHVDEHGDFGTPSLDERDLFDERPPNGVLTGQRLVQTGQFGEEQ